MAVRAWAWVGRLGLARSRLGLAGRRRGRCRGGCGGLVVLGLEWLYLGERLLRAVSLRRLRLLVGCELMRKRGRAAWERPFFA